MGTFLEQAGLKERMVKGMYAEVDQKSERRVMNECVLSKKSSVKSVVEAVEVC